MKTSTCHCGKNKDKRAVQCRECKDSEPPEKKCNGCGNTFPIESYSLRPNGRGGFKRRSRCKSCENKAASDHRKNNPEKIKESKRLYASKNQEKARLWGRRSAWKKMGLNPDEVEEMFEKATSCEICGRSPPDIMLCVDHCHEKRVFRGILCTQCNSGIGHFSQDKQRMHDAIKYLERHGIAARPTVRPTTRYGKKL